MPIGSDFNNYPPGYDENEAISSYRRPRRKQEPPRHEPLTEEQQQQQAEAFARVDEWDQRQRGTQFNHQP